MSSVNLMAQKTGHLLERLFWALSDINKRHEHLSQILNDSGIFGESLAPHPGAVIVAKEYNMAVYDFKISCLEAFNGEKTEKLKTLAEAGLILNALHPDSHLPVRIARLVQECLPPYEQMEMGWRLMEFPERFTSPQGAMTIRENVAVTLLHMCTAHEKHCWFPGEIKRMLEKMLESQLYRMETGSLARIVSRQLSDSCLTFSASLARLLLEQGIGSVTSGMSTGGPDQKGTANGRGREETENERHPIREIKRELARHMERHPRQVKYEHFELAMRLMNVSRNPEGKKNLMESMCDELFPAVYQTLLSPVLSPQSRAEGYALFNELLTGGQRQMIWEIQLETLPANIPSERQYRSPETQKGLEGVGTMAACMKIPELVERMQALSPLLKETLHPETIVPVISRLGKALQEVPVYTEPPSRMMMRELWKALPEKIRNRSEIACFEPPENEVALNWSFVCDCLSRQIDLPVLAFSDGKAKPGEEGILRHFPRTSRDGMTHLGNVAEFVMRQAGKGDESCVGHAHQVLPLLSENELKRRISSPEVQAAVASSPSLGTVVFFELRRREELAVGKGGDPEWKILVEQLGLKMTLSEPALVEKARGQNPSQGNLATHLSGREYQG